MNKTARYEGLTNLAGGRESGAARRLAECLSEVQSKEAELRQLRDYMDGYRQETEREDTALDTARWRNLRLFLSRLNDAVRIRELDLEAAKERYTQEAERWRACHRQTTALQQLVDKYYREDIQDAERRDQKELDAQVLRKKKD